MAKGGRYWLVKTEPDVFSVEDWQASKHQTTYWDGVRNYQARNFIRDDMKIGDRVLVYHSNADPTAIVGIATVVKEAYPDHTAFDAKDPHYDPKSDPDNPRWMMVDMRLDQILKNPLTLAELRDTPGLGQMELLRRGSRLSVQPVSATEWRAIAKLGGFKA
ncbi:MAG: EVE domain-containing protein [Planctomycetales bacterium]|nr:EVE domain-containing protein [Planctomycetales bacterium]